METVETVDSSIVNNTKEVFESNIDKNEIIKTENSLDDVVPDIINEKITDTVEGNNVKFNYYDEMLKHNTMSNDEYAVPGKNTLIFKDVEFTEEMLNNKKTIEKIYNFNYEYKYKNINIEQLDPSQDNSEIFEKYDQTYREDMLLAFNLAMPLILMNGDINTILDITQKGIEFLYEKFKDNEKVQQLLEKIKSSFPLPFELEDATAFMYLFSIDYLHLFHECLSDLYFFNDISEFNYETLSKAIDN